MKAILSYAVAAVAFLVVGAGVVIWLVAAADPSSVWLAAAIAWPVQLIAFWILLVGRRAPGRFMVGWAGGMALRFATLAGVAIWSTRTEMFDAATALVSLVGFVFVLVLLEPLFLRLAD